MRDFGFTWQGKRRWQFSGLLRRVFGRSLPVLADFIIQRLPTQNTVIYLVIAVKT